MLEDICFGIIAQERVRDIYETRPLKAFLLLCAEALSSVLEIFREFQLFQYLLVFGDRSFAIAGTVSGWSTEWFRNGKWQAAKEVNNADDQENGEQSQSAGCF